MIACDPTVPNWIRPPATLPLMGTAPGAVERLIVPLSFEDDCVHCRTNVPLNDPPYLPFQRPESAGRPTCADELAEPAGAALDEGGDEAEAADDDEVVVEGAVEPDDLVVALLDEHAATSAAVVQATASSFVRPIVIAPACRELAVAEYESARRREIPGAGRTKASSQVAGEYAVPVRRAPRSALVCTRIRG